MHKLHVKSVKDIRNLYKYIFNVSLVTVKDGISSRRTRKSLPELALRHTIDVVINRRLGCFHFRNIMRRPHKTNPSIVVATGAF